MRERKSDQEASLRASDLSSQEIRDALWLASRLTEQVLPPAGDPPAATGEDVPPPPSTGPEPHDPPAGHSSTFSPVPQDSSEPLSAAPGGFDAGQGPHAPLAEQPSPLALTRALRPLSRRIRSDRAVLLDEELTAEQAAESRLWMPVFDRAPSRWADVVLVVDDSPMMELWRATVNSFEQLLTRLGSFRTVQTRRIKLVDGQCTLQSAVGDVSPWTLVDTTGRRLVLVLTDGVSEIWRTGAAQTMVHQWARSQPVSIVHLLPQRMWRQSQIQPRHARLRAQRPFTPNSRVTYELMDAWLDDDDEPGNGQLPVPVLELSERSLGQWARLLGNRGEWTNLPVLLTGLGQQPEPDEQAVDLSPRDRVLRFRALASPASFRLATVLAAAPLSLPFMQAIQQEFVPASPRADLAGLMLSGLVEPVDSGVVTMEFVDGVRAELLSYARRMDTMAVARVVGELFGDRVPSLRRLRAALDDPEKVELPDLTTEPAAVVELETVVMRALSGPYLSRADRLRSRASRFPDSMALRSDTASASDARIASIESAPPTSTELVVSSPVRRERVVGGGIPPRNPGFAGREDILDDLDRLLVPGAVVTLTGMDGIGKTQTAAEYVHRHVRDYDLVWWVGAELPSVVRLGLHKLAREMGLSAEAEPIPAVHATLRAGQPYARWLLVFDNADDPELHTFMPSAGAGSCLVTSHDPQWSAVSRTVHLDVFGREQSIELLVNRAGLRPAQAGLVAEALGDLPVALDQAARWLAITGMPVPEYLSLLAERPSELLFENDEALMATWSVSMRQVGHRSPAAHRLLQLCASAPEPLMLSRLYAIREEFPFLPKELAMALRDPVQVGRAIRDLARHSLVQLDHSGDRIEMHPMVRAFVVHRMSEVDKQWLATGARMLQDRISQLS